MRAICQSCHYRNAVRRRALCTICQRDTDQFLAGFAPRRDSIEDEADSWAIGLLVAGLMATAAGALCVLVKSGLAQTWWPL